MRISDWSSDVCSSDLEVPEGSGTGRYIKNKPDAGFKSPNPYHNREARFYANVLYDSAIYNIEPRPSSLKLRDPLGIYDRRTRITINEIGRASGRERVCQCKYRWSPYH